MGGNIISQSGWRFLQERARKNPELYQNLMNGVQVAPQESNEAPGVSAPQDPHPDNAQAREVRPEPPASTRGISRHIGDVIRQISASLPAVSRAEVEAEPAPPQPTTEQLVARALERYPQVTQGLGRRARELYALFLAYGLEVLRAQLRGRPIPKHLSQLTFFSINRLLAVALNVSERTVYYALNELEAAGLVRRSPWKTEAVVKGRPGMYTAGTVFAVRLPNRSSKPRLDYEAYLQDWRNLTHDIRTRHTAWQIQRLTEANSEIAECNTGSFKEESRVQVLTRFSLEVSEAKNPLSLHSAIAELRKARGAERAVLVQKIALGLATELRDSHSVQNYMWLLWQALRAEAHGMMDRALEVLAWAVERVRASLAAWRSTLRRPGAVLMALLREQGMLDLLRHAHSWRAA